MIEPLNEITLKFFLDFQSDGTGIIEIDEPINFDGANFVVEQDNDRYGRDISFAAGEIELRFVRKISQLGHQFDRIIQYNKDFGYESNIQFIVQIDGSDYVIGELDFAEATTDQISYFQCKVIQEAEQVKIKRRHDVEVNVYDETGIDGNTVGPLQETSIFLRPNVYRRTSAWATTNTIDVIGSSSDPTYFNHISSVTQEGVQDTHTFHPIATVTFDERFRYVTASRRLENVEITFTDIQITSDPGRDFSIRYRIGFDPDISGEFELHAFPPSSTDINFSGSFTLPQAIPQGATLWLYFYSIPSGSGIPYSATGGDISITADEKQFMAVIPTVDFATFVTRFVALLANMPVQFSDRFTERITDQYVFNGFMLRGFSEGTLITTLDDLKDYLAEINCDYEIHGNTVYFGAYEDFYENAEIGVYNILPSTNFNVGYNQRYTLNKFSFNYDKFEEDRDVDNTLFSFQTESEWFIQNERVENNHPVEVPYIRDSFLINSTRGYNIQQKNTNSTRNDDDIFILDCIEVDAIPEQKVTFTGQAFYNADTQEFIITTDQVDLSVIGLPVFQTVNVSMVGPDSTVYGFDANLTKAVRGQVNFSVGLTSPAPDDVYLVTITYDPDITPIPSDPDIYITNRTDEGFYAVENISATAISNLKYTIKRNIINFWSGFLRTCTEFRKLDIVNTYFKNNGSLLTGLTGEQSPAPLQEDADISQDQLFNAPVVTSRLYSLDMLVPFAEVDRIMKGLHNEQGFIRAIDNEGQVIKFYPRMLDYDWELNVLNLEGEERYEPETITMTVESTPETTTTLNGTPYTTDVIPQISYNIENNFVNLLDGEGMPLINFTVYSNFEVNGETFGSVEALTAKFDELNETFF